MSSWQTKPWRELNTWEKQQRAVWEASRQGVKQTNIAIAQRLGIGPTTLPRWLNPDVREQRKKQSLRHYHAQTREEKREYSRLLREQGLMSKKRTPAGIARERAKKRERERTPEYIAKRRERDRKRRNPGGNHEHHAVDQRNDQTVS